jgi:hypothetical protein
MLNTRYLMVGARCWMLVFTLGCGATFKNNENFTGYNLTKPNQSYILPDTLREISGLTAIDSATFACVQDENGILFIYDLKENAIKKQYRFNIDGDYEGITRVGKVIYVLRSDGTLFEISDYTSPDFKLTSYATGIPATNNEGLCYDEKNNRLLIGCKGKLGKGPEFKDKRAIFGFDLETKLLNADPAIDINLDDIIQFASKNKIKLREKKNGAPFVKLMTSAICIHPKTGKLFLLSGIEHLFFVFDTQGKLEYMENLNPHVFNKAEGITFLDNGDMLITNEGQNKKPTLKRFNYKSKI